jgi:hypothetical protein
MARSRAGGQGMDVQFVHDNLLVRTRTDRSSEED